MKKVLRRILTVSVILLLVVGAFIFTACQKPEGNDAVNITVAAPNGAPALALAKLMHEVESIDNYNLTYGIKDGVNIVTSAVNGEADIALMPMNLAAKVYNEGLDVKLISTNIHGLLYIVGSGAYEGLESLIGEVLWIVGEGGTPDFTVKKILQVNNIPFEESTEKVPGKVAIANQTPDVLVPQVKTGIVKYALLGEPQASIAAAGTENVKQLDDLQELWKDAVGADELGYPQVGLLVKSSILKDHKDFVEKFLNQVTLNVAWVKDNPELAKEAVEAHDGMMPILNGAIVERCNLKVVMAEDSKAAIETYFSALPAAAYGGKLPDKDFYFSFS